MKLKVFNFCGFKIMIPFDDNEMAPIVSTAKGICEVASCCQYVVTLGHGIYLLVSHLSMKENDIHTQISALFLR